MSFTDNHVIYFVVSFVVIVIWVAKSVYTGNAPMEKKYTRTWNERSTSSETRKANKNKIKEIEVEKLDRGKYFFISQRGGNWWSKSRIFWWLFHRFLREILLWRFSSSWFKVAKWMLIVSVFYNSLELDFQEKIT